MHTAIVTVRVAESKPDVSAPLRVRVRMGTGRFALGEAARLHELCRTRTRVA